MEAIKQSIQYKMVFTWNLSWSLPLSSAFLTNLPTNALQKGFTNDQSNTVDAICAMLVH